MPRRNSRKPERIKVGYLPLYIKLYDDANGPSYRAPMEKFMDSIISMLESEGIDVVKADVCRIKPEFDAAAEMFNKEDVTAVITQHLAYSPSLESIDALLSIKAPLIVFDTTLGYNLLKDQGFEGKIGPNHGIHGVQDMCNLLRRNKKPYFICAGHPYHSEVLSEVVGMCRAAAVKKAYENMTVGSVGGSFVGMGDFLVSDEDYKKDIGCTVKYMDKAAVEKYLAKVTDEEVEAEIEYDSKYYNVEVENKENYFASTKSGLAVRKWMEEEKIGSASINFLTLDICGLPKMPFVECCKIMERGMGYAGEGDVLTAGLVGALLKVYPDTTFTEMFCPDWERDVIIFSHMGESNPNITGVKPTVIDCPFEYNSCGDTVAEYGTYRKGDAVLVNLAPMGNGNYNLVCTKVELLDEARYNSMYANSTQGWMKPCKPLPQFLKEYSLAGGTHHSALVYDVDIEEIKAFGEMMGFEVFEIK